VSARVAPLRALAFAVPISPESWRIPVSDALRAVDDLAAATAFEATFDSTRTPFQGATITVPVTIAFGDRDWILRPGSRRREGLPAHTTWVVGHGWGHVPMWVDPVGVSRLILDGTA
jgi:pimeloyl-ACP methyl ester carboxylesterase